MYAWCKSSLCTVVRCLHCHASLCTSIYTCLGPWCVGGMLTTHVQYKKAFHFIPHYSLLLGHCAAYIQTCVVGTTTHLQNPKNAHKYNQSGLEAALWLWDMTGWLGAAEDTAAPPQHLSGFSMGHAHLLCGCDHFSLYFDPLAINSVTSSITK